MLHPALGLLAVAVLLAGAWLLFWPGIGLVSLIRRVLLVDERERIEDALKHLYDCEYTGSLATIHSLAGALDLRVSRVAVLTQRLESLGLMRAEGDGLRLTPEGRHDALKVIRVHRLWEAYLADRTGFEEAEWHGEADRREHHTSADQLEKIVRATGNPRFDPHGDPIPTEEGEVLSRRGQPLSDLNIGSTGVIVHVEDEPEAIYAQLRAQSIHVGQHLKVVHKSSRRVCVEVDGEEQVMAPVVAANVSVELLPTREPVEIVDRLSSLAVGESREVVGIAPACQGPERRRLLDLGLLPGTQVTAVMRSPTRDPTAYRIRGALIALRHQQAELVTVRPAGEEKPSS
ncbi:metal-dependent transcriptional regulator [Aeoliella mucimassa]|uniref:Iron-dependent repressor IdeR n=1 Tax=Aeoliella mucimassa TaxID=2527972 RepID=A0A518ATE8_9BACT|nr:metal-dependent transcriptional regulator [Aeoliella mucimassa]QDU57998.1 Iron-dependent repressor IdeR [Aeoliella mucimassa]